MDSLELIQKRLREGLDHKHLESVYRRQCYAFGMPWDGVVPATNEGDWPVFPDIQDSWLKVGESRRLLNTAYQVAARLISSTPKWEFPQVTHLIEREARSAWMERRYTDPSGTRYDWRTALATTVVAGDSLGYSCVEIGLETARSGYQRVAMRHVPGTQVIYDRHALSPVDARWAATMDLMSKEDALAQYGGRSKTDAKIEDAVNNWKIGSATETVEMVPVVRYWSDDTEAVFVGSPFGEPLYRKANRFGIVPLAWYVHFIAPGMRYPVGRIQFQLSTAQMLAEAETQLRDKTREPNYILFDAAAFEQEDMEDLRNKLPNTVFIRSVAPLPQPIVKVERSDVTNADLSMREMLERQYTTDSGLTEMDRGLTPTKDTTKYRDQQTQQGAEQTFSAPRLQLMVFLSRVGEVVTHIARDWDRDPTWIDVLGANLLLNDPEEPAMHLSQWFAEPSKIVIAEESLTSGDHRMRRAARIAEIDAMLPYVQLGLNPAKLVEERVKAGEFEDLDEWFAPPVQQGGDTVPAI